MILQEALFPSKLGCIGKCGQSDIKANEVIKCHKFENQNQKQKMTVIMIYLQMSGNFWLIQNTRSINFNLVTH